MVFIIPFMVAPLSHIFRSTTRLELGSYIQGLIRSVPRTTLTNKNKPFIITINGAPGTGKSYIWDIIKDELLPKAEMSQPQSLKEKDSISRVLEIWHSQDNKLSIMLANYHLMDEDSDARKKIDSVFRNLTSPKMSDILILSNVPDFMEECADIAINLNSPADERKNSWKRETTISIPNDKLNYSNEMQQFFKQY